MNGDKTPTVTPGLLEALEEWWALWDAPGDAKHGLNSIPADMRERHAALMAEERAREAQAGSRSARSSAARP